MAAMLSVNHELAGYTMNAQANGYSNIKAVPDSPINGTSRPICLYRRAVYCTAAGGMASLVGLFGIETCRTQALAIINNKLGVKK